MEVNVVGAVVFNTRGGGFDGNDVTPSVCLHGKMLKENQKRVTFLIRQRETQLFQKF